MKILIIPQYESFTGGGYTFFKHLLDIHDTYNIKSAILLEKGQFFEVKKNTAGTLKRELYWGKSRSKKLSFIYLSCLFDLFFVIKIYLRCNPDLIHVSNITPGYMIGVFLLPCPIVFTMHSYPVSRIFTTWLSVYLLGLRLYLKNVVKKQKRFVTVSHESARKINQYMGVPLKFIEVIPNGVSLPSKVADTNSNIILTVGHVVWYKNPDIWIEVALKVLSQRSNSQFLWIGDGELLETMKNKVNILNINQNVFFCGSHQRVDKYYLQSSIYFQPSLVESQGIAVLEAMSYGLPCVVSNIGGLPESVVDGETGYVVNDQSIDGFVDRILHLIDDERERKKMATASRQRVIKHFTNHIQKEKIINLYFDILQNNTY